MYDPQQLFGRIALKGNFVSEDQLARGLRFQEEIRNLGLRKQLGEILLALGSMEADDVQTVLRLQALNQRAEYARRFGRVALKNKLIDHDMFWGAMDASQAEGFQRSMGTIMQELEFITPRQARAINSAIDRVLAINMGRREPEVSSSEERVTERLSHSLELEGEEEVIHEVRRRVRDLTFAAVALREGMVLVPELERAVEEQLLRADDAELEALLVERGVLGAEDVKAIEKALEASRHDRLVIPGYEVLDVLGYGVTSVVLRARHEVLAREVAIKLFHAEHAAAVGAEAMADEARAVAAVQHRNVVGIYEVGRAHRRVYYVMELVDGPNLAEVLRERGALLESEVVRLARDICRGLAVIHEHGLVHRDVKPLNVLFDPEGSAMLTDLGLVCETGLENETGALFGSPLTMSPEQAQGEAVDARADLYGLGATLYNAVTGEPPYAARDTISILMDHMSAPVPDPRKVIPDLSDKIAELIMGLLSKTAAERPQSAKEVLDLLGDEGSQ